MAVTNYLLKLFGWKTSSPPKSKMRKGEIEEPGRNGLFDAYSNYLKTPYNRRQRYDVYDDLDEMDIIESVLNAYAEDASQVDREKKVSVWIECGNAKAKNVLTSLFERLRIEDYSEAIIRDIAKQGDDFAQLDIVDNSIKGWDFKDPREIERVENRQGTLVGFELTKVINNSVTGTAAFLDPTQLMKQDSEKDRKLTFKPWDIVHFRLYKKKRIRGQNYRNIYGTALLDASDRIGKQVKILDDMLMVHRLTKTLDRNIYTIDTGTSSPEEEIQIIKTWRNALKRKPYLDPANSNYNQVFDPFTWAEDIFWPQKLDSQSSVDTMTGQGNVSDIVDVMYFIDRLFGSLRAPKGYFGFEGEADTKSSLSSTNLKWGRSCNSLQKAYKNGLVRLCQIELALQGIDPYTDFSIGMVVPSILEDLSRLEAIQTFIDIAERMASLGETLQLNPIEWRKHIMNTILGMTDKEIETYTTVDEPNKDGDTEPKEVSVEVLDEAIRRLVMQKCRQSVIGTEPTESARKDELPGGTINLDDFLPIPIETN